MLIKRGQQYKFKNIHFWAQDGGIIKVDTRTDPPTQRCCSRREFLEFAEGFSKARNAMKYADEKQEMQNLIEAMIACVKEAKAQGDQFDSSTWKWRVRSSPTSVMMSPAEASPDRETEPS